MHGLSSLVFSHPNPTAPPKATIHGGKGDAFHRKGNGSARKATRLEGRVTEMGLFFSLDPVNSVNTPRRLDGPDDESRNR
jgi:hypothetical protein